MSDPLLEQLQILLKDGAITKDVFEQKKAALKTYRDKARAQKLFKRFDKNADGLIDFKEFHQLILDLGEIWTPEEVKNAIVLLDSNCSGGLNFADFYQWWLSSDGLGGNGRLDFLKMKLRSENYLRHVYEIANNFAQAQLDQEPAATDLDICLTFGDYKTTKSSIKLVTTTGKEKARDATVTGGGSDGDSVGYVVFNLKPTASSQVINELCDQLNLGLAIAKNFFKYDKGLVSVTDGPDRKQLIVSIVFSGRKQQAITEVLKKLWTNVNFFVNFEFDQSPDEANSEENLNLRFSLKGTVPHMVVANAKRMRKIPEIGGALSEIIGNDVFQQFLPIIQFGGMDLHLGSLTEIAKTFLNTKVKEDAAENDFAWYPVINNWDAVRELVASFALKTVLQAKEVRKHGLKNYFKAETIIESVAKAVVTSQQITFELLFNNFNIIKLLPTKSSLGFEYDNSTETVVDDLKLLAFKVHEDADSDVDKDEKSIKLPTGPRVILQNNFLHHTFERDEFLVLENSKPGHFTINHVMVKASRISKNPVKHAFFWAFNELPELGSVDEGPFASLVRDGIVTRNDDDHITVAWPPKEHRSEYPFAHVQVGKYTFYGECHLQNHVTGRYVVALFADYWESKKSRDTATVQYVGFVGPAEKPIFKNNLRSKFGLH